MSTIRTPFNFVSLSDKVFIPNWSEQISQDIPFADGLSGTIDLTITAKSPIFIRNGHTKKDADEKNGEYLSFSHINGADGQPKYFIPATSIKGEVRTLLEIMSFSKMSVDSRSRFARRDLNDKTLYPLMSDQQSIHCGWLKRKADDSGYTITDCGRPMRISQPDIDQYVGRNILTRNFSVEMATGNLNDEQKTATYKYQLLNSIPLEGLRFTEKDIKRQDGSRCVRYDSQGNIKGTIVLTGQPGLWKPRAEMGRGKYYEFVFSDEAKGWLDLTNDQFNDFKFIYQDSKDWERVSRLLDDRQGKGVPIFFRIDKENETKVLDFGLAYLYKLPYERNVHQALPPAHHKVSPDLAQCIFGYVNEAGDESKNNSLKGRVQFGNAMAKQDTIIELAMVKLPLATPKASYLPIYIKQDKGKGGQLPPKIDKRGNAKYLYKTYDTGTPSGWKRYYRREDNQTWGKPAEVNAKGKDTQNTFFIPLKEGAVFTSTISFHNLRPVELGALLCALEFAGVPGCLHQLGQAKPYGYGLCKYDVTLKATKLTPDIISSRQVTSNDASFIDIFKMEMTKELGQEWQSQRPIENLLAIALCPVPNTANFQYMSNNRNENEFLQAKKSGQYLKPIDELPEMKGYQKMLISLQRPEELKRIEKTWRDKLDKAQQTSRPLHVLTNLRSTINTELNKSNIADDLKPILEKIMADCNSLIDNIMAPIDPPQSQDLQGFMPRATSFPQWEGRITKWLKKEGRTFLTQEEQDYAFEKLREAFNNTSTNKAQKQKWKLGGSFFKKCARLVGEILTGKWFTQLSSK